MLRTYCNHGFTWIEVLVSLCMLSLILFGFESVLLLSIRETEENYYFSIASHQMLTMLERIQALKNNEDLASQIKFWDEQNKQLLPHGRSFINGEYPSYTVTIQWGKKPFNCNLISYKSLNCLSEHIIV